MIYPTNILFLFQGWFTTRHRQGSVKVSRTCLRMAYIVYDIYIYMYAHIIYHHIIYIGISKSQVKYGLTGKCAGAGIREVAILGWVLEILETLFGLWFLIWKSVTLADLMIYRWKPILKSLKWFVDGDLPFWWWSSGDIATPWFITTWHNMKYISSLDQPHELHDDVQYVWFRDIWYIYNIWCQYSTYSWLNIYPVVNGGSGSAVKGALRLWPEIPKKSHGNSPLELLRVSQPSYWKWP